MVRQLRVAQGRFRTYRFLTGEGSAALVKKGQGRTDRAGHRRAIFRITRHYKDIYIASATLTNCLGNVCQGHKFRVHAKLLGKSLNFQCLNVQISMLRRNTSFRLETIFYQSLEHKI